VLTQWATLFSVPRSKPLPGMPKHSIYTRYGQETANRESHQLA
jgi:hypothetical protein